VETHQVDHLVEEDRQDHLALQEEAPHMEAQEVPDQREEEEQNWEEIHPQNSTVIVLELRLRY
jgi:hypothetical protein